MSHQAIQLTGIVVREGKGFYSLCPEVDVASQGTSVREAKSMLKEAVSGYLESCFESNLPYLRPVPMADDPRFSDSVNVVQTFRLTVDLRIRVHV